MKNGYPTDVHGAVVEVFGIDRVGAAEALVAWLLPFGNLMCCLVFLIGPPVSNELEHYLRPLTS